MLFNFAYWILGELSPPVRFIVRESLAMLVVELVLVMELSLSLPLLSSTSSPTSRDNDILSSDLL